MFPRMGSRVKEDERTEKAIRNLLKLPENRRCINCNSLGPQYVCSTFWTFVCTNCSGIHREFTHRVKSISMAKFTSEEVNALRAGGNERAREIYFKEWDVHRDGYPDGSNIFKLRDFIRHVYVEKRFSSDQSNDKISKPQKPPVTEDYRESKKGTANFLGSRSFHSVEERSSSVGRSRNETLKSYFDDKNHKQNVVPKPKSRGLPKSPIRFEIVDDRYRDDGSVKRYEARKESRGNSKSLDLSSNKDVPSLPMVRHTSELLGKDAPKLRVSKVEQKKDPEKKQVTVPSEKVKSPVSLMDDEPVSEPSDGSLNKNSSEVPASLKTTEKPAPNSLEALLFGDSDQWNTSDISSTVSVDSYPAANLGTQIMLGTSDSATSFVTPPSIGHAHAGSSGLSSDNLNIKEMDAPSVATNNQGPSDTSVEQSTILAITNYAHEAGSDHHQDETQSNIRKALPEDLFSGGFSFAPQQVLSQHHGMGYGMQYYQYPVAMAALPYTTKPANPFDVNYDDTAPNQTSPFPYMAYHQGGGLPHMSAADTIGLMNSQSPFLTTVPSPSPGLLMGPQTHMNMPPSFRQEFNGLGSDAAHAYHQANNGYTSTNPNAYSSRRNNPFE